MPLFVFLSGAVFALTYKESTDFKSWTIKRIKKLMVPYFIVAIILYVPTRIVCVYYDTGINTINIICNMEGSACFCIFWFFEGSDEVKNKFISVLDSSSLTIYFLHPVIIMLSKQVIHMAIPAKYMSNVLYMFLLAIVLLLSILIPCIVSKILRRISQKI